MMTTVTSDDQAGSAHVAPDRPEGDDSLKASLAMLEDAAGEATTGRGTGEWMFDADYFARVGVELRRLHARLRIHHAASSITPPDDPGDGWPPELCDDLSRLRGEHPDILGKLDRLVRSAESVADRPLEDKEVFVMRIRELIAVLRRHEAEEDRLFYLAIWRDTG